MITHQLQTLARAMAEHEGWISGLEIYGHKNIATVAYRNHNPGNLRASPFALGKRDGFAVFLDDNTGFFALLWDLRAKATGNTRSNLNGDSTIAELIEVYAPSSENDTEAYIKHVQELSGLPRDTKLKTLVT